MDLPKYISSKSRIALRIFLSLRMLPLAYRLSRRVELSIDKKKWPILFTHDVLLDILELTGMDAMAGMVSIVRPSMALLRAMLWSVLHHAGAPYSLAEAGKLLRFGNLPQVRSALIEAWDASMPEPEKGAKPAKPLSWMEAWAIARRLELSDREWRAITPRMLQALSRENLEHMRWMEMMMGTICANVANYSFCAPKHQFHAKDFLIHPYEDDGAFDPGGAAAVCSAFGIPAGLIN